MFFNRAPFDLSAAVPGTFALAPHHEMVDDLRRDYAANAGMIFGEIPAIEDVLASVANLEATLNEP